MAGHKVHRGAQERTTMGRLLVIDHRKETRALLKLLLERNGHEVRLAENGEEGLAVLAETHPEIIFTAVEKHRPTDLGLLRAVKNGNADIEVIVIIEQDDIPLAIEALEREASDFICKPINEFSLRVAIRRAMDKIHLRNKLREYIAEIQKRYDFEHNLILSSMDGIIANDRRGNIIIFNDGASRIYGYTREEAFHQIHVTDLYPEGVAREIKKLIYGPDYGGPGRLINYETQALTKDKRLVPMLLSAVLLFENGKEVAAVGYFKDLTELKRLEEELVHNTQLAAIGQAMAEVAHGVKNILYGMKLGAFMVDSGLQKQELGQVEKGWVLVNNNMNRIARLSLDMLSYARKDSTHRAPTTLNAVVNEVCDSLMEQADKRHVTIERELCPDLPMVSVDAEGFHACILNLVTNAMEAFPESTSEGRIVIKTGMRADGQIYCTVVDTGKGMSQELQNDIFKPLFTTKSARGTGLGLAITQKIIKEHNGSIEVDSELNRGSTFTVLLPSLDG
ncbi:MAG TPA: hypothetical protein DCE18_00875 [Syntrophobacteraceae bacterium]|nr:hypothetical protein [Syntrophobacteraceae bacterium]